MQILLIRTFTFLNFMKVLTTLTPMFRNWEPTTLRRLKPLATKTNNCTLHGTSLVRRRNWRNKVSLLMAKCYKATLTKPTSHVLTSVLWTKLNSNLSRLGCSPLTPLLAIRSKETSTKSMCLPSPTQNYSGAPANTLLLLWSNNIKVGSLTLSTQCAISLAS